MRSGWPEAVRLKEVTEVGAIALGFVISHEACCGREVDQAIVAVHGAVEFPQLGV